MPDPELNAERVMSHGWIKHKVPGGQEPRSKESGPERLPLKPEALHQCAAEQKRRQTHVKPRRRNRKGHPAEGLWAKKVGVLVVAEGPAGSGANQFSGQGNGIRKDREDGGLAPTERRFYRAKRYHQQ